MTAAAAAKVGLGCVILHNAERPARIAGNLLLNHLFGAEIHYLGPLDEDARDIAMAEKARELRKAGANPYIVGDAMVGAVGYVVGAEELLGQARPEHREPPVEAALHNFAFNLLLEARDADFEKLIEIRIRDAKKLHPL